MTKTLLRAGTLSCALLASTCLTGPARAQAPAQPSVFQHIDANGVDLTDGSFNFSLTEGTIGAGEATLAIVRSYGRGGKSDGLPGRLNRTLSSSNNRISLTFGSRAEHFDRDANFDWVPQRRDGATLTGSGSFYTYTASDGTTVDYGAPGRSGFLTYSNGSGTRYCTGDDDGECELLPLAVTRPNGRRLELHWRAIQTCGDAEIEGQPCSWFTRLAAIGNESAYLGKYLYADNTVYTGGPPPAWFRRTGVQLVNTAVAPCDPQADSCTTAHATIAYSADETQITDAGGGVWQIVDGAGSFTITRPGSGAPNVSVTRDPYSGIVSQVIADTIVTNYHRSDAVAGPNGPRRTMTITNPVPGRSSIVRTVVSDVAIGRPVEATDALQRTTRFAYDAYGRPTRVTAPLGNYVEYVYDENSDVRGNVTRTIRSSGTNSPSTPPVVTSAVYPATCANPVTCNLPASTTDARGNVTEYEYHPTHGGTTRVRAPAPNGVPGEARPQVRNVYEQLTDTSVWVLRESSACRRQAPGTATGDCIGTANELRTVIGYEEDNLLPVTVTTRDGTGTLSATMVTDYDPIGNVESVDGPLSGTADTVHFRYDAARRRTGTISPDPDPGLGPNGTSGPLQRRAEQIVYRTDGQIARVRHGNVESESADLDQMVAAERVEHGYDTLGRQISATQIDGATTVSVSHFSYDELGRPKCAALRMNRTDWGASAIDACHQGSSTGAEFGPDRISRTELDDASQVTRVVTGVGVLGANLEGETHATTTYTDNGQVRTLRDGEGNRTTFEYDGLGRLLYTRYPVQQVGIGESASTSGTTGFEELVYETLAGGTRSSDLVVSRRTRGGDVIAYTHDALGRTTSKILPGAELDVTYAYDLFGGMISASQPGHAVTFAYDALGRLLSQTNPRGQLSYGWDAAGRRTRITWPDGYFADYSHLHTGEVSRIVANSGTSSESLLGSFGYDDRGRRTSFVRAGGSTAYSYPDANSSTIQHNLPGPHSVTIELDFNPAGQIVRRELSNDAYAWTGDVAGTVNSSANGRNQLETLTGATPEYDARGNMTRNDAFSFGYDSENRMTGIGAPGGALSPIPYDPLGRLVGDGNTTFLMDPAGGDAMVGEYWSTGFIRYVPGAGVDEPIAQVRSTGVRRDFYADERGSVIAVDEGGGAVYPQTYDEYGRTTPNRYYYRFGYTGQARLTRDLYYYKARIYWGAGGRFLQPDPIGYGDGMNLYAYAGGDPVNGRDPSGTETCNTAESRISRCWRESGDPQPLLHVSFGHEPGGTYWGASAGFGGDIDPNPIVVRHRIARLDQANFRAVALLAALLEGDGRARPHCIGAAPAISASPETTSRAINAALSEVYRDRSGPLSTPYSSEFAEMTSLPDVTRGGWAESWSGHAGYAWEIGIPSMPGQVLKVYVNDRDAGGRITAAITPPTWSAEHVFAAGINEFFGYVGNASRSVEYLRSRQPCN